MVRDATPTRPGARSTLTEIDLATALCAPPGFHVFVRAPGGAGKSCLARTLSEIAIERFTSGKARAIPVRVNAEGSSLEEAVQASLGLGFISPDVMHHELATGGYILVLDGLTESSWRPAQLRRLLDDWPCCPVLVTLRPHSDHTEVLRSTEAWMEVRPGGLEGIGDVTKFIAAYNAASPATACPSLPGAVVDACRGLDGRYSPIMLRLALLSASKSEAPLMLAAAGPAGLFRTTLERLLGAEADATLQKAAEICRHWLWDNQQRTMPFRDASGDDKTVLRTLAAPAWL